MNISRNLILAIAALGLLAGPASSLEARNRKKRTDRTERRNNNGRGARVGGVLLGAGAGGGIAAAAGSAKWAALGAPLGGLAGYLLIRAIQKGRKNRRNREHKNKEMRTDRNR